MSHDYIITSVLIEYLSCDDANGLSPLLADMSIHTWVFVYEFQ